MVLAPGSNSIYVNYWYYALLNKLHLNKEHSVYLQLFKFVAASIMKPFYIKLRIANSRRLSWIFLYNL